MVEWVGGPRDGAIFHVYNLDPVHITFLLDDKEVYARLPIQEKDGKYYIMYPGDPINWREHDA